MRQNKTIIHRLSRTGLRESLWTAGVTHCREPVTVFMCVVLYQIFCWQSLGVRFKNLFSLSRLHRCHHSVSRKDSKNHALGACIACLCRRAWRVEKQSGESKRPKTELNDENQIAILLFSHNISKRSLSSKSKPSSKQENKNQITKW